MRAEQTSINLTLTQQSINKPQKITCIIAISSKWKLITQTSTNQTLTQSSGLAQKATSVIIAHVTNIYKLTLTQQKRTKAKRPSLLSQPAANEYCKNANIYKSITNTAVDLTAAARWHTNDVLCDEEFVSSSTNHERNPETKDACFGAISGLLICVITAADYREDCSGLDNFILLLLDLFPIF